jgi:predicted esterase
MRGARRSRGRAVALAMPRVAPREPQWMARRAVTRAMPRAAAGRGRAALALALGLFLTGAAASAAGATPGRGWQRFDLPATGSYFWRYVPASLDASRPAPLVIFLHGAGGTPDVYMNYVYPAAERAGCVVAMPKSASDAGWGTGNDEQTVALTRQQVGAELPVDPNRVSIAGHSAGGAYAYLLAYGTVSGYNAVFTLSAPFYAVSAVADPNYKAPIHMYYGTTDPNYTGGAEAALRRQWAALGVAAEEDVEAGYGHNYWPPDSMASGFLFLAGKTYLAAPPPTCAADANHLCLQGGRFRVEVAWDAGGGHSGAATATPAVSADSGVFWFFSPENWEILVKVLDGCAVNRRIWVFAAAVTDVHYTLTVTDTVTGQSLSYDNPAGQTARVVTDTAAFDACR